MIIFFTKRKKGNFFFSFYLLYRSNLNGYCAAIFHLWNYSMSHNPAILFNTVVPGRGCVSSFDTLIWPESSSCHGNWVVPTHQGYPFLIWCKLSQQFLFPCCFWLTEVKRNVVTLNVNKSSFDFIFSRMAWIYIKCPNLMSFSLLLLSTSLQKKEMEEISKIGRVSRWL